VKHFMFLKLNDINQKRMIKVDIILKFKAKLI